MKEKSLAETHSEIAKEWHSTKNGELRFFSVSYGSEDKYFLVCEKGHEWDASPSSRYSGSGCPICNKKGTSFSEQAIFYYLFQIFNDTINGYIIKKFWTEKEIDIFIKTLNLGIEYDGSYFHRNKSDKDNSKSEFCKEMSIDLVRIREVGCPKINEDGITVFEYTMKKNYSNIGDVIVQLLNYIKNTYDLSDNILDKLNRIDIHIERDRELIKSLYIF